MNDRVAKAEERLRDRMAAARASHAAWRRSINYALPIGLMAVALLFSVEGHRDNVGFIPLTPELAAAVLARVFGGVRPGRFAVAMACPLALYIGLVDWVPFSAIWFGGYVAALIGLCVDVSWLLGSKAPSHRSPGPRPLSPPAHHMLTQWRSTALQALLPRPL